MRLRKNTTRILRGYAKRIGRMLGKQTQAAERKPAHRITRYQRIKVHDGLIEEITEPGAERVSTKKLWLWLKDKEHGEET